MKKLLLALVLVSLACTSTTAPMREPKRRYVESASWGAIPILTVSDLARAVEAVK